MIDADFLEKIFSSDKNATLGYSNDMELLRAATDNNIKKIGPI